MAITLDNLPTEVLLITAGFIDDGGSLTCRISHTSFWSLSLTNRRLHDIFNPILWRFNRRRGSRESSNFDVISAVWWAASRNRIDILEIAVKNRHHLGSFLENDPIHLAARNGHDATVSWLLDHGVPLECTPCKRIDVDSPFTMNRWPRDHVSPPYSALYTALVSGQESTSILLLSRGAKYHFKTESNTYSAIHLAASHGLPAVIEYLVKTIGVDVNERDRHGDVPLHHAAERRENTKTMQVLLGLGANINIESCDVSPLSCALSEGHFSNAMMLLDAGADVNPLRNSYTSPLIECVKGNLEDTGPEELSAQHKVLCRILENGAIVNDLFREGTALSAAAEYGAVSSVYELLRAGADVNIPRGRDGATPLNLIWCSDEPDALIRKARLLIAAGARLDTKHFGAMTDSYSKTELENAIDYCLLSSSLPLQELLLVATHRNVRDGYIDELFEKCLKEGQLRPARILVQYGATSNATNELLFTQAIEIINADYKTDFHGRGQRIDEDEVLSFCLDFLSVQQIEELFQTALDHSRYEDRCHLLIDRGALSYWKEAKGFKPWLHTAVSYASRSLVKRLVRAGMDINAQNEEGKTPMMIALEGEHDLEMAALLFELGADPFHPRPGTNCRRLQNTSFAEILSPFELAIRKDLLPEIRRWWFDAPPESRPTEELQVPRVLSKGPWYQNYLKYLRSRTDGNFSGNVHESQQWDMGWTKEYDMLRFNEDDEKKTSLMFEMDRSLIPPHFHAHDFFYPLEEML